DYFAAQHRYNLTVKCKCRLWDYNPGTLSYSDHQSCLNQFIRAVTSKCAFRLPSGMFSKPIKKFCWNKVGIPRPWTILQSSLDLAFNRFRNIEWIFILIDFDVCPVWCKGISRN